MKPELIPPAHNTWTADSSTEHPEPPLGQPPPHLPYLKMETASGGDFGWIFLGNNGLRAGWSVLLFVCLIYPFATIFGTILAAVVYDLLHLHFAFGSAASTILGEGAWVAALGAAALIVARLEHRRFTEFNLADSRLLRHLLSGALVGFLALSVLVGIMLAGGWMHVGPTSLDGARMVKFGALWGAAFLLVGLMEEGTFRCFLLFTLTRGLNFWWALATVGALSLYLALITTGHGAWGVYTVAGLGLVPCLWLHRSHAPGRGFWQAAWATSTGFGFIHTFNNGENWIGILAAAAIGFVFCVSVRLTGSAWWAIGCHASWDWAESYFYGTADSGFAAKGHLLTATPAGPALWSGGADGPEGSLLVLPVIVLLLLAVLALYGRRFRIAAAEAQGAGA